MSGGPEPLEQIQAVIIGQAEIQDQRRIIDSGEEVLGTFSCRRDIAGNVPPRKTISECLSKITIVVDYQQPHSPLLASLQCTATRPLAFS